MDKNIDDFVIAFRKSDSFFKVEEDMNNMLSKKIEGNDVAGMLDAITAGLQDYSDALVKAYHRWYFENQAP